MQRGHASQLSLRLAAVGFVAVVPLASGHDPGRAGAWAGHVIATAAMLLAALAVSRSGSSRLLRWSLVAVIAWCPPVVDSARSQLVSVLMAVLLGFGLGGVVSRRDVASIRAAGVVLAGAVVGAAAWIVLPRRVVIVASLAAALAIAALASRAPSRSARIIGTASLVALAIIAVSVGATSPRATWFGGGVRHGTRSTNQVALTFDDGPNAQSTLAVRDVLDQFGIKGTFFVVGSALDAQPDIERTLLDDGQLLGSHAYHHNTLRWASPHYDELDESLRSMKSTLGICPTFFRPPHGFRTPFVARSVQDHHMKMVLWDVSAADWATNDAALVAQRVLGQARPGSIILLHDGLDGQLSVDRSVVVRALPEIITGLRARGLEPVRLDQLLGTAPYAGDC